MNKSNKVYLIAGEASGDLHGSNLLEELLQQDPNLSVRFWGGDRMEKLAGPPVKHIKELAFMGFFEVVANLRTIARNLRFCKSDILEFQPDVIVLIDYPGFNLRISQWAKKKGIRVFYYISPQVWAWKESRVKKIKASVDEMFVILPFEKQFYQKHNFQVHYHGHPLLDEVEKFRQTAESTEDFLKKNDLSKLPIIALLPGSRKQEIAVKLPIMLDACSKLNGFQYVVAGAPSLDSAFYLSILSAFPNTAIVYGQTYDLLNQSTSAVVTSGTATLETALLEVPQVVCYKGNSISYHIAKRLIKINYISLVNLIMDEEVVKELIQNECNSEYILKELKEILPNGNKREQISLKYKELISRLGGGGASHDVAAAMLSLLKK